MPENILSQVIADLEPSATEEVDNAVARMRQRGVTDIVSLGVGEPCFDTPDNIKQSAADALFGGETKYQPTAGAYALREAAERTVRRSKVPITEVRVAGGGSQSHAAMQITADVFGLPAARPHTWEASGLGAAIDAAVGLGLHPDFQSAVREMTRVREVFEPNPRTREIYDELYSRVYERMYARLRTLYREIRDITDYPAR